MGRIVMSPVLKTWLGLGLVFFSMQAVASRTEPFRILTEHNPPAEYVDDSGRVTGVTVELVRLLQQRLKEPADIELMPWGRALNIARSSNNTMLFETVRTPEREPWFNWVGPIMLYNISLYGLKHRIGDDPEDRVLPGKFVACNYVNSITAQNLAELGFKDGKNLLLTSKGQLMITDFGLAGLAEQVQADVRSGTPAYMAPEQARGGPRSAQLGSSVTSECRDQDIANAQFFT